MAPLFTVETDRLRLTWSGPVSAQRGAEPLAARALGGGAVRLAGADRGQSGVRPEADVWLEEETGYPVLLQSLDGGAVELRHRDPVVTGGLVSVEGGRVAHGRVRFGSQAGRARFEVWAGGRPQAAIAVSVLPTKVSEAEVAVMRAEVEAAAAGLAVSALRPTTIAASGGPAAPSVPVWLAALRAEVGTLAEAVREIERRPALDVARASEPVRTGRIARADASTRRAAGRYGLGAPALPARPARLSADTPAHRWLATRLAEAERRVRTLAREEAQRRPSPRRAVIADELADLAEALGRVRAQPVLRTLGGRAPAVAPLVLRRRPAYAAAFDALRRLDHGLSLRAGALDVAVQDLAVLYETWVALAVVRATAEALGADVPARPFGVWARGTDVALRRGQAHAVRLASPETGARVEIAYNPRFPAPPALLAQRPDLVLTVWAGPDAGPRRVVLDAKYRRDDSAGYRRRHGAAGPPEDALGALHRYRDAIADGGPPVTVAAALFPGDPDDAFRRSRLWTSLGTLGVGAVPLRPGRADALAGAVPGGLATFIGGILGRP